MLLQITYCPQICSVFSVVQIFEVKMKNSDMNNITRKMIIRTGKQEMAVSACLVGNVSIFGIREAVIAEKTKQYQEETCLCPWMYQ